MRTGEGFINGKLLLLRPAALGDQVVAGQHLHAWFAQSWVWCNWNDNFQAEVETQRTL